MRFQHKVSALIGDTPMIRLERLQQRHGSLAEIVIKLEYFNPAGSIKDRVVKLLLDETEARGLLAPHSGQTLVAATSGSGGASLASIASMRGYACALTAPEDLSAEYKRLLSGLTQELVLTPAAGGMSAALAGAEELARRLPGALLLDLIGAPANIKAHYKGTGPELWEQCGSKIDIFVHGIGSGGAVTGIGRYLKECSKTVKIYGVEPAESPLLSAGRAGQHTIAGLGFDFVPDTLDRSLLDGIRPVSSAKALETARELMRLEGIRAGISSGAAVRAALELAALPENRGKRIACIACDSALLYLSTPLFTAENTLRPTESTTPPQ